MYCPKCNTEYVEKIDTCADCHVALVPALKKEQPLEEKYWVKLQEFPSKTHAEMAGEILRNNGLHFYLKSSWLSSALQISGPTAPGNNTVIFTPEAELEEARLLIAALTEN
ncbi:MAG: hypothetical protein V3S48_00205 [Candidatus Neomarinimicrobiota bacterium]